MLRTLLTIGFLLFLAAAGVWYYRNHWSANPADQQAEARSEPSAPSNAVPEAPAVGPDAAPAQPQPQPVQERPAMGPGPVVPPPVLPHPPTPRVGKKTHVVAPGETLWAISRRYFGTPNYVEAIADANQMGTPNRLRPGMVLVLPEIPGIPERSAEVAQPAPRSQPPEALPYRAEPMPPTLSNTVPAEP